jgi:amino acid transporter
MGITNLPAHRLHRNALGLPQIIASTLANIAPAVGFYFGFGVIVGGAGVAAPLTIMIAMIAILFLCNTLAEFSKYRPSTGSFVTFIGMAFGPVAGAAAAIFTVVGYAIGAAAIVVMSGGWTHDTLQTFLGINVPWQLLCVVCTLICGFLVSRGIGLSTKWAAGFFYFETGLLLLASVVLLVVNRQYISLAPFMPSQIAGGLSGIGLGFPLAIYLFIGWENSVTLAEEAKNPRRNIPLAMIIGTIAIGLVYVFIAYATEVAFHNDAKAISASALPFTDALKASFASLLILAYIAGLTSIFSCLIGLTNSQARILFSAGREGLLPAIFGKVDAVHKTPRVAMWTYILVALAIVFAFGWNLTPIATFGNMGTLGAIPVIIIYVLTNIALPVYMLRSHREAFSLLRHAILPALGTILIAFPLWGLVQPGQPAPFNLFPIITAVGALLALAYGFIVAKRNPNLAARIGSFIADQDA